MSIKTYLEDSYDDSDARFDTYVFWAAHGTILSDIKQHFFRLRLPVRPSSQKLENPMVKTRCACVFHGGYQ